MFSFIRTRLIARILCIMTVVILCITAGNIAIQRANTGTAVKGTISSYNMSIASHYVTQMDAGRYSEFLADPRESDLYWSLRNELDQFRVSIGARYVYFVRIDEANQPQLMIDGRPEGTRWLHRLMKVQICRRLQFRRSLPERMRVRR